MYQNIIQKHPFLEYIGRIFGKEADEKWNLAER